MKIDPAKVLTSCPPQPCYYCPECDGEPLGLCFSESGGGEFSFSALKAFDSYLIRRQKLSAECITSKHVHYHLALESEGASFVSSIKEDITAYELLNIKTLFESLGKYEYTAEDVKQTMSDLGILRHFEVKDNA